MTLTKFNLGDRVTRDEREMKYLYPNGQLLTGTVIQVYGRLKSKILSYNEPEFYDVHWDNKVGRKYGYLPHGLDFLSIL